MALHGELLSALEPKQESWGRFSSCRSEIPPSARISDEICLEIPFGNAFWEAELMPCFLLDYSWKIQLHNFYRNPHRLVILLYKTEIIQHF